MSVAPEKPSAGLVRSLGLVSATTIVMGSMIGSGIFIVSADISRQVGSPGLLMLVWVLAAFMTIVAALSYGELAAAMPHAGGQYVYLRESLSPLFGFLYGWTLFLVIQTGTVAAVGVAFAKFAGVFFPGISTTNLLIDFGKPFTVSTQQAVGILCVVSLTAINCFGVAWGALVQNLFTFAKAAALFGFVVIGYWLGTNHTAISANFNQVWGDAGFTLHTVRIVAVSMVGALFAADAWNNVTFTAGETENPRRNVPLALLLGTGTVLALYIAANFVYLSTLPFPAIQHAAEDRVGTAAVQVILGQSAEKVMAAFIVLSSYGCCNGLILAGARVYYAMARDGLFFDFASRLHPRTGAPVASLVLQCLWTSLLTLSGSYNELLNYVIFAVLLFYVLTIGGLFVLRVKRPQMERPYRAWGYPALPATYILLALLIEIALLKYQPDYTWPGLIIVLLGVPVYLLLRKRRRADGFTTVCQEVD